MGVLRWGLGAVVIAFAAVQSMPPFWIVLFALSARSSGDPAASAARAALEGPVFGAPVHPAATLMRGANPVQLGLWITASILFGLAGLTLFSRRPRGAVSVFCAALVVEICTGLTFKRSPLFDAAFSAGTQNRMTLCLLALTAAAGLIWIITRDPRRPAARPVQDP
jgi:hypothetical protein